VYQKHTHWSQIKFWSGVFLVVFLFLFWAVNTQSPEEKDLFREFRARDASMKWVQDWQAMKEREIAQATTKRTFNLEEAQFAFLENRPYVVYGHLHRELFPLSAKSNSVPLEVELLNLGGWSEPDIKFSSSCDVQKVESVMDTESIYPVPYIVIVGKVLKVGMIKDPSQLSLSLVTRFHSVIEEGKRVPYDISAHVPLPVVHVSCDYLQLIEPEIRMERFIEPH